MRPVFILTNLVELILMRLRLQFLVKELDFPWLFLETRTFMRWWMFLSIFLSQPLHPHQSCLTFHFFTQLPLCFHAYFPLLSETKESLNNINFALTDPFCLLLIDRSCRTFLKWWRTVLSSLCPEKRTGVVLIPRSKSFSTRITWGSFQLAFARIWSLNLINGKQLDKHSFLLLWQNVLRLCKSHLPQVRRWSFWLRNKSVTWHLMLQLFPVQFAIRISVFKCFWKHWVKLLNLESNNGNCPHLYTEDNRILWSCRVHVLLW